MPIFRGKNLTNGLNTVISTDLNPKAQMDFEVLLLNKDQKFTLNDETKEYAILLLQGKAQIQWQDHNEIMQRASCFRDNPACLLVPAKVGVEIIAFEDNTRFVLMSTENEKQYAPIFLSAQDCKSENRGEGTLNECATRVVRSFISRSMCPNTNLIIGEVVNFPGKWSSFPPHSHIHPEIYYYNFLPSENAYGIAQEGDKAHIIKDGDALLALDGDIHPQVSAPGYALFYVWVIRDSDEEPHIAPPPVKEHAWTVKPGVKFFPESF